MSTKLLTNAALTTIALSPSLTVKSPLDPILSLKVILMEFEEVTTCSRQIWSVEEVPSALVGKSGSIKSPEGFLAE